MLRPMTIAILSLALLLPAGAGEAQAEDKLDEARKEEGLTLEPTRTIDFTVSEGTWLSLDVSPDGGTILFELLGDLYTLPIEGGEAQRLTSGMPFDSQPRYSPDGKWIAFLSDRSGAENVWISRPDGTEARKLSEDEQAEFASPDWTPDGEYVVVSRTSWGGRTFELWMYHVRGGAGVQITKANPRPDTPVDKRHNALGPEASPDGRYLYYAQKTGGFMYNASFPMWQVARRDRITGDEDVLTQAQGSAFSPRLSPDGRTLVYGTRHDAETGLRLRDLETGEDRWLILPVQRDDQEARFTRDLLPGYAFLPDGSEIVLSFGGRIHRVALGTGQDTEIPFTAKVSQPLGPRLHFPHRADQGPVRARIIQDPAPSPDGRRLAFSALTRLYLMSLPDGSPERLSSVDTRAFQPAWSPDGRWIAYVTWDREGGHVFKVPAEGGGDPERLTATPAFYADPVWSPDGTRIVALRGSRYMRERSEMELPGALPLDLVSIPIGGGEAELILPSRGLGKPHFGPEPDRVYVHGLGFFAEGPGQGLVSLRFDGTDRREHVKVTGKGIYAHEKPVGADDIRISPDGKWVLASVQNQLYLLAIPRVGGEAPVIDVNKPTVPARKLTTMGADYFTWGDGGRTLVWAVGSTLFRQALDTVSFEKPDEEEGEGAAKEKDQTASKEEEPPRYETTPVIVEVPRSTPSGRMVLRGARVVTMNGDEVIEDADLVVKDNRIEAVGRRGEVSVPEGARTLDVTGKTVVPGFVDTHAHWTEIRRGVLDTENWSFLANLAYGVTTGLDVQTFSNDMFAYQDLVEAGEIVGLRAYSTGPGIFSNNAFETLEEARGVIRKYKEHYRTRHLKSYIVGNRKQRQLVAQAAQELQMMPTTEGGLDLKLDLTHVSDGFTGSEHALPIVPLYQDVTELVARSGIGYTPTLLVNYGGPWAENYFYTTEEVHDDAKLRRFVPHAVVDAKARRVKWFHQDEHSFPKTAAQAAKIVRAGGRVGVGSHGQLQGLGYHWEMWALASGGFSPHEVLRAATLHGAEILGLEQDLGSLEPGRLADLVVLDEDPLADIRNTNSVRFVMKNGELFEGESLRQIWPIERDLEPLYWWEESPISGPR